MSRYISNSHVCEIYVLEHGIYRLVAPTSPAKHSSSFAKMDFAKLYKGGIPRLDGRGVLIKKTVY